MYTARLLATRKYPNGTYPIAATAAVEAISGKLRDKKCTSIPRPTTSPTVTAVSSTRYCVQNNLITIVSFLFLVPRNNSTLGVFVLYRWRPVRLKFTLLLNKIKNDDDDDDENNNKNKPERNLPFLLFTTLTTPVRTVKTVLRCAATAAVCILDVTNNKSFPIIPNISTLNKTN